VKRIHDERNGGYQFALSGALIPGPLSIFIVRTTMISGKTNTGFLAALGHCLVELIIIGIIILGLSAIVQHPTFQQIINLIGGSALILFGMLSILGRKRTNPERHRTSIPNNSMMGGVLFTVLNATIPLWWATIGFQMLTQALMSTTMLGVLFWVVGHWLADISWFSLLGYSISKGKIHLNESIHNSVVVICGMIMIFLGLFFFSSAILPG
jgi:threonine/homoserine/homoserine lactone efflux protein